MTVITSPQTVYIIEAEAALSQSLKCLLETSERVVRIFQQKEDFWAENAHRNRDIVLLNFERHGTGGFEILNKLLCAARRPHIVITSAKDSVFNESDKFLGGGVTIMFHPVTPTKLVEAINNL